MSTIQDTVGRLAIAKENIVQAQKMVAQVLHTFFEREDAPRATPPPATTPISVTSGDIDWAIDRLEMAVHDLKIVQERISDG